jgi:Domain of unknown function (DUF2017)
MEMFRSTRDGGATVRLSAGEATLLRTLVVPVMELLNDPDRPAPSGVATTAPTAALTDDQAENADLFNDLERLFSEPAGQPPAMPLDPVLARLLPDAYEDDIEAAGEFRRYTESSLREAKKYFALTLLETLPPSGGKIRLTGDQARDWLRALNDIRLMFGVRLEVTEDFEEQLAALDPRDPKVAAFEVYGWLGAVQESLVRALAR